MKSIIKLSKNRRNIHIFIKTNIVDNLISQGFFALFSLDSANSGVFYPQFEFLNYEISSYSKLSNAMGIKVPYVKLFSISPEEKRPYFNTEYIAGIEYLDIINENIDFNFILENDVANWQDFFKFKALYCMFNERDSFEIVLTSENFIYKIDNTASFDISNFTIDPLGIDMEINDINIKLHIAQQLFNQLKHTKDNKSSFDFDYYLQKFVEKYGRQYASYFLQPLSDIQNVSNDYIDSFLNNLCYIYPDFLGDFYKQYIDIIKIRARNYLKANNFSI
ncbi:MAG: hypothetical protein PWP27_767 [Clostridiales bacterium]|nr:hypothetical protein [Clostridiales bacterium]